MKKSMQIPKENPDKECDISEFPAPARASDGNFKVLDSPKLTQEQEDPILPGGQKRWLQSDTQDLTKMGRNVNGYSALAPEQCRSVKA
jgi:hypothetical protein